MTYMVSEKETPMAKLNPALKPLLILYLMIMKMTGPTERDKNTPRPNPAMNDVIICINNRGKYFNPLIQIIKSARKLKKFPKGRLKNVFQFKYFLLMRKDSQSSIIPFLSTLGNLFMAPSFPLKRRYSINASLGNICTNTSFNAAVRSTA